MSTVERLKEEIQKVTKELQGHEANVVRLNNQLSDLSESLYQAIEEQSDEH